MACSRSSCPRRKRSSPKRSKSTLPNVERRGGRVASSPCLRRRVAGTKPATSGRKEGSRHGQGNGNRPRDDELRGGGGGGGSASGQRQAGGQGGWGVRSGVCRGDT